MKKVYYNTLRIFLVIIVLFFWIVGVKPVYAKDEKTMGDLRSSLKALQAKKTAQENAKKQTQAEIQKNKNNMIYANAEMEKAKEEVVNLENQIENTNKEIEDLKEMTKNILILYQQLSSENIYASYITGASSMTELVMRVDLVNQLTDYNKEKLNELELLIETNEKSNKELVKYQKKLNDKIIAYEAAADKLKGQLNELELGVLSIEEEIKTYQDRIKYYEGIGCKDDQLLTVCDNANFNNSGWLKPVSKGRITSLYGYRTSPTAGASSNHKGIDIGISEGTKVYGTAVGKVVGIVNKSSCGGNMVYIQTTVKGEPYTYVFMHMLEIWVKVGDVVRVDTVVGLSGGGSTGYKRGGYDRCTTGAHLHYGLAKGHIMPSKFNSYTINPPGYPGLYQWFYSR